MRSAFSLAETSPRGDAARERPVAGKSAAGKAAQQAALTADPRWQLVLAREAGDFFYAVQSTGIYCRPTCPSRRPKPGNICFFDRADAAEAAGFRPCLRCHPQGQDPKQAARALVAEACRQIARGEAGDLQSLAAQIGLSPWHFHRLFKAETGLTPKGFEKALRLRDMAELQRAEEAGQAASVTQALYAAGFGSAAAYYRARAGRPEALLREKGKMMRIEYAIAACDLGWLLLARNPRGICALTLGDAPEALRAELGQLFAGAEIREDAEGLAPWLAEALALVKRPAAGLSLPLDLQGTLFQEKVWQALQQIPPGETRSYSALAEAIGAPEAVRAVAGACAANKIAIAVPCHRILRKDGGLSGYRWGKERKQKLLLSEAGGEVGNPLPGPIIS